MQKRDDALIAAAMLIPTLRRIAPMLAGASLRDRTIASVGALIGILLTALTYAEISPFPAPMIVAPLGASAVLLFAVPASPLAQPWSIIGGNSIAVVWGLAAARFGLQPAVEAAIAVSGAILVMSVLRCLHPPGGAVALGAAIAGAPHGPGPAMVPVILGSLILVAIGLLFHRYSGHSYPHRPVPLTWREPPPLSPKTAGVLIEDVDAALAELGETFDVSREDLLLLFAQAEAHADVRLRGSVGKN